MKIIVGLSNGQTYELSKDELYKDAERVASFINMEGLIHANFLKAKDGTLIMPKQVVYVREVE